MATFLQSLSPDAFPLGGIYFILLVLALLISSIGFYRVVYFISIGYAFSIVSMAIFTTAWYYEVIDWVSVLHNFLFVIWGLRLGIFLLRREMKTSYKKELKGVHERSGTLQVGIKFVIWTSVSLLYVLMFSPSLMVVASVPDFSNPVVGLTEYLGLGIMAGGLLLETMADRQKSAFKAENPSRYCDVGLYRWVRCPNYLGEVFFWLGNWVMGLMAYQISWDWIMGLTGLICLVYIMMSSTKRLENSQEKRYGALSEYQHYIQTVPVLFPFLPIYSFKKLNFVIG